MTTVDLLFTFPRWLRLPRGRIGENVKYMFSGAFRKPFQNAFAATDGAPHWATAGGTIAPEHIAAWTPKNAGSLAGSYVQFGTLPSSFGVGIAPTWNASTGWTFNGSTQYLKSGIAPQIQISTWSMAVRWSNANPAVSFDFCGSRDPRFEIGFDVSLMFYGYGNSFARGAAPSAAGNVVLAGRSCYLNGVLDTTVPVSSISTVPPTVYIGARHNGVSTDRYFSGNVLAFAIWDIDVSAYASVIANGLAAL